MANDVPVDVDGEDFFIGKYAKAGDKSVVDEVDGAATPIDVDVPFAIVAAFIEFTLALSAKLARLR